MICKSSILIASSASIAFPNVNGMSYLQYDTQKFGYSLCATLSETAVCSTVWGDLYTTMLTQRWKRLKHYNCGDGLYMILCEASCIHYQFIRNSTDVGDGFYSKTADPVHMQQYLGQLLHNNDQGGVHMTLLEQWTRAEMAQQSWRLLYDKSSVFVIMVVAWRLVQTIRSLSATTSVIHMQWCWLHAWDQYTKV